MLQQGIDALTPRETEVLTHVAIGKRNKEIALTLGISEATVENHLTHIYQKLNVGNRTEASGQAHRLGIVQWG